MQDFMPALPRAENPQSFAVATRAEAEMKARFALAALRPREPMVVRDRLLADCRRPAFAEMVKYRKPLGDGKFVEGPSIRFVEAALRAMGNVLIQNDVVFEDDRTRSTRVTVTDLETNIGYERVVTVSKVVERRSVKPGQEVVGTRTNSRGETTYLVAGSEDQVQIKEAAGVSKALRTLGERIIAVDLRMEAIEVAGETVRDHDAADPSAAVKKMVDAFQQLGVGAASIAKYVQAQGWSFDAMTSHQLANLRGLFAAIRDGEINWLDVMQEADTPTSPEEKNGQKTAQDAIRERMEARKHAKPTADTSPPTASTGPEASTPTASTGPEDAPPTASTVPEASTPTASTVPEDAPPTASTVPEQSRRPYNRTKILRSQAEALQKIAPVFILQEIGAKYADADGVVDFGADHGLVTKDDADGVIAAWANRTDAEYGVIAAWANRTSETPVAEPAPTEPASETPTDDDLADAWEDVKAVGIPAVFAKSVLQSDLKLADAGQLRSVLLSWQGPSGESWRRATSWQAGRP